MKFPRFVELDGADQLPHELHPGCQGNGHVGIIFLNFVGDGVEKVGLAQPRLSINIETGVLCRLLPDLSAMDRCYMAKVHLIERPHDKIIKRLSRD